MGVSTNRAGPEALMDRRPGSSPFSNRSFRLLFAGGSISVVGDQFTLVALPWLVLQLTGNPAQLGLVLAVMALPRAVLILVGGAVVDRMSARRVLINARAVNAFLVGSLAALVLGGAIHMWMLYGLAAGIGVATAFAYPASSSLMPRLLAVEQLHAANSLMMAARQLSLLIGPALAGLLISAGAATGAAQARGTGIAFAVDAASFLISVGSLLMIRLEGDARRPAPSGGILANLVEGVRTLWRDSQLRALIGYFAAGALLVAGPLQVALPLLAKTRLAQGAVAYGILMTANGAGMLLGSAVSGSVTRRTRGRLGVMLLTADTLIGLAVASLSVVHSLAVGAAILVMVGVLQGSLQISMLTWLQRRSPHSLMGRTMSLVMFAFLGVAPLAAALAGLLVNTLSLTGLLAGSGALFSAIALACLTRPSLRAIRLEPVAQPTGD